jgi:hypothetical protein
MVLPKSYCVSITVQWCVSGALTGDSAITGFW